MTSPETIQRGVAVLRAGYADGRCDREVVAAVYAVLLPGDRVGADGKCVVVPIEFEARQRA